MKSANTMQFFCGQMACKTSRKGTTIALFFIFLIVNSFIGSVTSFKGDEEGEGVNEQNDMLTQLFGNGGKDIEDFVYKMFENELTTGDAGDAAREAMQLPLDDSHSKDSEDEDDEEDDEDETNEDGKAQRRHKKEKSTDWFANAAEFMKLMLQIDEDAGDKKMRGHDLMMKFMESPEMFEPDRIRQLTQQLQTKEAYKALEVLKDPKIQKGVTVFLIDLLDRIVKDPESYKHLNRENIQKGLDSAGKENNSSKIIAQIVDVMTSSESTEQILGRLFNLTNPSTQVEDLKLLYPDVRSSVSEKMNQQFDQVTQLKKSVIESGRYHLQPNVGQQVSDFIDQLVDENKEFIIRMFGQAGIKLTDTEAIKAILFRLSRSSDKDYSDRLIASLSELMRRKPEYAVKILTLLISEIIPIMKEKELENSVNDAHIDSAIRKKIVYKLRNNGFYDKVVHAWTLSDLPGVRL